MALAESKSVDLQPFRPIDLEQLRRRGVAPAHADWQYRVLKSPPPAIELDRPCTLGDGIEAIARDETRALREEAEQAAAEGRVLKFVPASGAASRMFKKLMAALEDEGRPPATTAGPFFDRLRDLAFYEALSEALGRGAEALTSQERAQREVLTALLQPSGLGYAGKPKALIAFHRFGGKTRTAFEEHLLEAAHYARDRSGTCRVHFTVAAEHRAEFEQKLSDIRPALEGISNTRFEVSFSEQHPSTDTIALSNDGSLFRLEDGSLLFRPGGHGALLLNLSELQGDLVVIKNVDNVIPAERISEVVTWKKLLIGLLCRLQQRSFAFVEAALDPSTHPSLLDDAISFIGSAFSRRPPADAGDEVRRRFVLDTLDRPIRVCGVVRNEGEPGGAPFWVRSKDGGTSIQIVESSQIDFTDQMQAQIWNSSTHFNPVDIVCGIRNYRGQPFDLSRFVDINAVFIARKSHLGNDLRALELPGLWNGAMAGWNTVCVEVPASTFAPVKTVFDLLRPEHQ